MSSPLKGFHAVTFVLVCLAGQTVRAEPVVLAAGGRAGATIVLPGDAPARLRAAADDLRHYVQAVCGVELPLRADGEEVEGTGLYIGTCAPSLPDDMPGPELNPEAFAVRVRGGNVFFAARHPTPAAFAVYTFIEEQLGVRWFAPGELWEFVPPGNPGNLAVDVTDRVVVPGTSPRVWSGHDWHPTWSRWNLRNKTVMGEVIPRRQFQNRLHTVFPPETYAAEHPEYYPLVDGKRRIPAPGDRYWRPCESNPDVQRITVEAARRWFDENPDVDSFSLGMDDIGAMCGCENCRALDPHPDSYEKREFSDRHYRFVNAVAREVAKTHPDRYIGTLIYNIARELPETVERLEPNVFGFITENCALWWQDGRRDRDHALTAAWAERCAHLSRYDYYGLGTFTPRYYPHAVAEQMRFDKSLGMEGMYLEVYTFLPHTAPMIWMIARLQWDHTLDADGLLDEFNRRMYGPAAGVMAHYWDLLEASWNTPRPGRDRWVHRRIVEQALAMSPGDVDEGFRLLEAALAACDTDAQRQRIAIHRDALRFSSYAIRAYDISARLRGLPIRDRASADAALDLIDRLSALSAERVAFHAEVLRRDDLLGRNVRGMTEQKPYMPVGDYPKLEQGGFAALTRVLAWYEGNDPAALGSVADRLDRHAVGSVANLARAWLQVAANRPENLLVNGDFEDTGPNAAPADQPDWSTADAPRGWSRWSRNERARFDLRREDGSVAASISGADSATYLQTVAVKPGESFLCFAKAKTVPAGGAAAARLGFRFREAGGAWHERRDLEGSVETAPDLPGWQVLAVHIAVPEGAGTVVIMPGASGQADGSTALFDDVRLYRLAEAGPAAPP